MNHNVISVRIFIAFHMLKTNICYIMSHRPLTNRDFYVLLRFESAIFVCMRGKDVPFPVPWRMCIKYK